MVSTTGESDDVILAKPAYPERNVLTTNEKIVMGTAEVECSPGDVHFDSPIFPVLQQILWSGTLLQLLQDFASHRKIHGTPVIGIRKAEVPDFCSPVDIG